MNEVAIVGVAEVPYQKRPDDTVTTGGLLAAATHAALQSAGMAHRDIDGLGVSSHTLKPDRVMDLAWHLGLQNLRWAMDGPPAMNVVKQAVNAVAVGDANAILVVAGDRVTPRSFEKYTNEDYNRAHRDYLSAIPLSGPNPLYALLTREHMRQHGLPREAYGAVVIAQRQWAARNPSALYRDPLTMDAYLNAPVVADPLTILDCVPLVAGANAVVVARAGAGRRTDVHVRSIRCSINHDAQNGSGFPTGLRELAPQLWREAGIEPLAVDLVAVYDDYPVMVLAQLQDLGFVDDGDFERFIADRLSKGKLAVNTSGGLLTVGQPGAGGGLHGLVECVRQLRGERGSGQLGGAKRAIATGYGMIPYRYGAFVGAVILEHAS